MPRRRYNPTAKVPTRQQAIAPAAPKPRIPPQPWPEDGKYWHTPQEACQILARYGVNMALSSIYQCVRKKWNEGEHYQRFGPTGGLIGINICRVLGISK